MNMRNLIIASLVAVALTSSSAETGLVAWYKLDGNGNDSSGNGHHMSVVDNSPTFVVDRFGNASSACHFSGNAEHFIPADDYVVEENFTVCLWFKTSALLADHGSSGTAWNPGNYVLFPQHGGDNAGIGIKVGVDGIEVTEHGSCYLPTKLSYKTPISGWNHLALTVSNNGNPVVYLNGVFAAEGTASGRKKLLKPEIGGGGWGYYTGDADDVRVYNRALSAAEIQSIYSGTSGQPGSASGRFTCTQYDMNVSVSSLDVAKSCLADQSKWKNEPVTKQYDSISFADGSNIDTAGFSVQPFPGNTTTTDGKDHFVMTATGRISIPEAGDWSFTGYTDDGFELKLTGNGAIHTMSCSDVRASAHTIQTFSLDAGVYDLQMVHFDYTERSVCILAAARGNYSSFNSSAFKLIGDPECAVKVASEQDEPEVPTYTISFNANGGATTPSSIVREEGAVYGTLPMVTRSGYAFDGWYTAAVGGEKVSSLTTAMENTTLYAHWATPAGDLAISNIEVLSGYPWKDVLIGYTITGSTDQPIAYLEVTAQDNASGTTYACKTLEGADCTPGTHILKWKAQEDGAKFQSDNVVFTIRIIPPPPPLYCVIDLSGGADAASYLVTELAAAPSGGWTDAYKTTKLVLRRIEAGSFTMGSPACEIGRSSNETQNQVTLTKAFYIGVFEVTQRQWELVMGTRPSYFSNNSYYAVRPVEKVSYNMIRGSSSGAGWPGSSAVDASSFLGKLRARTGLDFDLPTEAQWEYACRAGTTTALNSGNNLTSTSSDANMAVFGRYWYNGGQNYSSSCATSAGTAAVGSYFPNAWGLYDMHGNVWEWCLDWYADSLSAATDPLGPSSGSYRVERGGSWNVLASLCRSSSRSDGGPSNEGYNGGFRLVRTLPE